jgi:hypothetical protein
MMLIKSTIGLLFSIAILYIVLRYKKRLNEWLLPSEKPQNNQNENPVSPDPAICAAIIAAVNLHKSKQR